MHAPELFDLEVASVVCKRIRRHEISASDGDRVVTLLERVPVRRHPDRDLLRPAVALAQATGQSLYDCLYLALALIMEAQLVTADVHFHRAVRTSSTAQAVMRVEDIP
ncbi:MAG TPA: type II toxin-antitoxin system VapC family toxin [Candidatus Kryptonia bacterium]|nr:type II toxin-antitoxin system VapC family toxin [Candidatus Kryptonia bacterium]